MNGYFKTNLKLSRPSINQTYKKNNFFKLKLILVINIVLTKIINIVNKIYCNKEVKPNIRMHY